MQGLCAFVYHTLMPKRPFPGVFPVLILLLVSGCGKVRQEQDEAYCIIPEPVSMQPGHGHFRMTGRCVISFDPGNRELEKAAGIFRDGIRELTDMELHLTGEIPRGNAILLETDPNSDMPAEGYTLTVDRNRVSISASQIQGIRYGLQTLRQMVLCSGNPEGAVILPCVTIRDHPRFNWRGMHLDVCRHFFPVDSVRRYIDFLAMYHFNRFHWHLTEDQGWRIEIKKYPELTRTGAWRVTEDGGKYGGFYTQDEVRDIVRYAADRGITVVPEIEMPGHAQAAIAAYPELGVTGKQLGVMTHWGISPNIFLPSENTFDFLKGVLDEVMELFPSRYIHIGGDEAIKDQWKASRKVQSMMREKGLENEEQLQRWFIGRIGDFLAGRGRTLIGWDEILQGGLTEGATVMSWRGMEGGIRAAREGHDAIMCPYTHCYLNYSQSENEPVSWNRRHVTDLEKVYNFEPVPAELAGTDGEQHIIGAQGCIWTEHLTSLSEVEEKLFPRLAALSEVLWSDPSTKDIDGFRKRLRGQEQMFRSMDINYYHEEFEEVSKN